MLNFFCLNIAGLNITVESNSNSPIILQSDPAYENFIFHKKQSLYDIVIKLTINFLPDISNLNKLFDNNESWSLFTNRNSYYICFQPPIFEKPYLVAETDKNFTTITISCSDFLIVDKNGIQTIFNPVHYPIDQIILMHYLSQREGAIFHAAGTIINDKSYLFMGRSGAGKSTLTRLCKEDNRFSFLSDDRIIVKKTQDKFQVFGTPWPGDEGIAINNYSPLAAIFYIHHGTNNKIDKISPQKSFEKLLPITSIPWYEEDLMSKMLSFCEKISSSIPSYDLYFTANENISNFLYDFIKYELQ